MVQIGAVTVADGAWLAPMAGVTDSIFREMCAKKGAALTCTEMISAKGLSHAPKQGRELRQKADFPEPAAIQLFGREPDILTEMAEKYAGAYSIVDVNMGCPAPKIVKTGQGCALMREPELAETIIRQMTARLSQPVTVKIRMGWDANSVNYLDFSRRMEDAGAAGVVLHGRTRDQFYAPYADWDCIRRTVEALDIPVIGNGDIFTGRDALRMLKETGCAAVMIGRAAQGNPWIFSEVRALLGNEIWTPPTVPERMEMAEKHARRICLRWGERFGVPYLRKHMAWYLKGINGASMYRREIMAAESLPQVITVLHRAANTNSS